MSKLTILTTEPLKGLEPDEVRGWLKEHATEHDLAVAMSAVWNKTGWLHHELNDDPPTITEEYYCEWNTLEEELFHKIIEILESEAQQKIDLDKISWIEAINPFMNRNGFYDGRGWWIKNKT